MLAQSNRRKDWSGDEVVDGTLRILANLEESLAHEVTHLTAVHAPAQADVEQARYGGKALWWWRFKLLTWIHAREVCSGEADDLLRGLRLALKQWEDAELLRFLRHLGRMGAQRQQQRRGRTA